jgi:hypothetical protein
VRGSLVSDHRLHTCLCRRPVRRRTLCPSYSSAPTGVRWFWRPPPRLIGGLFDLRIQGGARASAVGGYQKIYPTTDGVFPGAPGRYYPPSGTTCMSWKSSRGATGWTVPPCDAGTEKGICRQPCSCTPEVVLLQPAGVFAVDVRGSRDICARVSLKARTVRISSTPSFRDRHWGWQSWPRSPSRLLRRRRSFQVAGWLASRYE